ANTPHAESHSQRPTTKTGQATNSRGLVPVAPRSTVSSPSAVVGGSENPGRGRRQVARRVVTARFATPCAWCPSTIEPGEVMTHGPDEYRDRWLHRACADI